MDRQSLDRVFAVTKFYHLCVISLPQMSTELLIGLSCNHLIPCRLWYFLNVIIALRIKDCIPAMVSPLTERYAPLIMIMCKVTQYLLRWGLSIYLHMYLSHSTCHTLYMFLPCHTLYATPFICFTVPHPLYVLPCHTLYMFYHATPFICFTMPHPLYVLPCHTLYRFYHVHGTTPLHLQCHMWPIMSLLLWNEIWLFSLHLVQKHIHLNNYNYM